MIKVLLWVFFFCFLLIAPFQFWPASYYHKAQAFCWEWTSVQSTAGEFFSKIIGPSSAHCSWCIYDFLIVLFCRYAIMFWGWCMESGHLFPELCVSGLFFFSWIWLFKHFFGEKTAQILSILILFFLFLLFFFFLSPFHNRWKTILQHQNLMVTKAFIQLSFHFYMRVCSAWKFRYSLILLFWSCCGNKGVLVWVYSAFNPPISSMYIVSYIKGKDFSIKNNVLIICPIFHRLELKKWIW